MMFFLSEEHTLHCTNCNQNYYPKYISDKEAKDGRLVRFDYECPDCGQNKGFIKNIYISNDRTIIQQVISN